MVLEMQDMPSSPKIKREDMLQATLDIVIEKGYPNITLLEPIAEVFCVSVAELISGNSVSNSNVAANMNDFWVK